MKSELRQIGQHDVEAEGEQQRVQQRRAHDEIEQTALHDDSRRGTCASIAIGSATNGSMPAQREQEIDDIAAQHDEGAMGEIDDVEHAPYQRHAERHQPVEAAQQDAVDQDLNEKHRQRPARPTLRPLARMPASVGAHFRLLQAGTGNTGLSMNLSVKIGVTWPFWIWITICGSTIWPLALNLTCA